MSRKPARHSPSPRPNVPSAPISKSGLDRRRFLKWAIAGAVSGAAGVALSPHAKRWFGRPERQSVKSQIENHPDARSREIFWYKPGPGKLREAGKGGMQKETYSEPPLSGDRSSLHTHPLKLVEDPYINQVNRFLFSNPSPQDAWAALDLARTSSVRTAHVAVMNEHGKVMGYWSWRYKKSLLADAAKCDAMARRFEFFRQRTIELSKTNPNGKISVSNVEELVKVFRSFTAYLEQCRKDGLIIHRTPAAGYHYKDGYFQPK